MKGFFLWLILFLGLGLFLDQAVDTFTQLLIIYIFINIISGLGLNLINGMAGQFSLGHAGFMAVGAYSSALFSLSLPGVIDFPGGFLLLNICGGLIAAFVGFCVGLPSLRLKGDYLAIVTLGFGEIIRVLLLSYEKIGGARGLYGFEGLKPISLWGFDLSSFFHFYIYIGAWVSLVTLALFRIRYSSHGRAFLSVREDEIAAISLGISVTHFKVKAFVLSSFIAGVAGSLFAHYTQFLTPATFSFQKSVELVTIVVLGGMSSITGTIVAAIIITLLPEILRPLQGLIGFDLRMVIYSLMLVLLMILRPQGLFATSEIFELWKKFKNRVLKHA